jgi:hydrogenase-4 component B
MSAGRLAVACTGAVLALAMVALGIAGMAGAGAVLAFPSLPFIGTPHFVTTPFGGFFTLVAGCVAFAVSLYSGAYLTRYPRSSPGWFAFGYAVLLLAIAGIFSAADVVSFTIAWEVMALSSSSLVAFDWREQAKVRAAVLMLAMSEFGTLGALLAFLLAGHPSGSLGFAAIARSAFHLSPLACAFVCLLSFFGFGVKAGILPFNSWLPRAYPVAPSNVSAIVAGVLVNCGIYGMLLVNLVLVPQNAMLFGVLALAFGTVSAFIGILFATIDDDLKRMLAFSSVENMGIVVAALGAGAIFFAMHRLDLAALGFGAGLWHMANHSSYKALLFLGAGAVETRAGTRRMNRLGGIARAMPVTALCFLIGALAIAAVPPLNGFGSEWLTLETLLRSAEMGPVPVKIGFVLAGALLALTAALAVTCFVKAYAMTFLGAPRSDDARSVRADLSAAACAGMAILAALCIVAGIFPTYVVQLVDLALPGALHGHLASALVPPFLVRGGGGLPAAFVHDFTALGAAIGVGAIPGRGLVLLHRGATLNPVVFAMSSTYVAVFAAVLLAAIYAVVRIAGRRSRRRAATWAGGLVPLGSDLTYTATGFSNPVRVIFEAIFNPHTVENTREAIHDHFRVAITREREDAFVADRFVTEPLANKIGSYANALARMHHGRLEGYVSYALVALVIVVLVAAFA